MQTWITIKTDLFTLEQSVDGVKFANDEANSKLFGDG
jgi:hypothetical protein